MLEQFKREWACVQNQRERALKNLNQALESGEGVIAYQQKRYLRGIDRMSVLLDTMEDIALDQRITPKDKEVLIFLLSQCTWENWINIPIRIISERLGRDKGNISKAIDRLVSAQYILKEKVGRQSFYRFNPECGWKGKDKEWAKVVDLDEIRQRQSARGRGPATLAPKNRLDDKPVQLPLPGTGAKPRSLDDC